MKTLNHLSKERTNDGVGTVAQNNCKELGSESKVKYQCPMKCHGEEVYDEPGLCPDSKMQMIPVGAGHIFF